MKKVSILLLAVFSLSLANCSSQEKQETAAVEASAISSTESAADEPEMESADSTEASASVSSEVAAEAPASADDKTACDKFLTDYEDYANSYAALAAKYAKNPMDMSITQEYTEMAAKAQEMQQDKPDACEADAAFMKRYTRVTAKVTKAAAAQMQGSAKMLEQMSK
jgi:hypothetical protein